MRKQEGLISDKIMVLSVIFMATQEHWKQFVMRERQEKNIGSGDILS